MAEPTPKYSREFLTSVHHAWLGLLTLGAGIIGSAVQFQPIYLVAGATAYVLGWIYLPGMPFFKRWVDRRVEAARNAAAKAEVEEFIRRRHSILSTLSTSRRKEYDDLARVCEEIEKASAESPMAQGSAGSDPRLRKLDELMWTYLRMLSIEESLDRFLETEERDEVPRLVREGESEVADLGAEIERLKPRAQPGTLASEPHFNLEAKQRLLTSRLERLEVLQKRRHRIEQARANLALVISEQERLGQQIKLIRADAIASKNAQSLTARIDATVEHLDQTNKWLAEMVEFTDLVGDLPSTDFRVGFKPLTPPPMIEAVAPSPKARPANTKERQ